MIFLYLLLFFTKFPKVRKLGFDQLSLGLVYSEIPTVKPHSDVLVFATRLFLRNAVVIIIAILVLKAPIQSDQPALLRRELLLQRIYKEIAGEMAYRALQTRHTAIERIKRLLRELENEPWVLADHLHEESCLLLLLFLTPKAEQRGKRLPSAILPLQFLSEERTFTRTSNLTNTDINYEWGFFPPIKWTNPEQGNL